MKTVVKHYLQPGDKIDMPSGLFIVSGFDGLFVTCREYFKFVDGDLYFLGLHSLYLFEIARLLEDVDGLKHEVVWYEKEE